ncbi:MAG: KOW motif-containing protein, partial [Muribaculaceae bacterium]|nr:KOW motif-containing protein [Muribaculaceae bacterium]
IAVAGHHEEEIVYLDPAELNLTKGDRVRVLAGPFAGAEGVFVRVKGDRRVVVTIEGVVAVATTFVHPSLIEKI